jgi:glutaredoxin 3
MTKTIDIYTQFGCPYCSRAKQLLSSKGAAFVEHDVTMGGKNSDEMKRRAPGSRTVPQIFIGDVHVGGCDELYALETSAKLDPMLRALENG